jgi:hypothetical protein
MASPSSASSAIDIFALFSGASMTSYGSYGSSSTASASGSSGSASASGPSSGSASVSAAPAGSTPPAASAAHNKTQLTVQLSQLTAIDRQYDEDLSDFATDIAGISHDCDELKEDIGVRQRSHDTLTKQVLAIRTAKKGNVQPEQAKAMLRYHENSKIFQDQFMNDMDPTRGPMARNIMQDIGPICGAWFFEADILHKDLVKKAKADIEVHQKTISEIKGKDKRFKKLDLSTADQPTLDALDQDNLNKFRNALTEINNLENKIKAASQYETDPAKYKADVANGIAAAKARLITQKSGLVDLLEIDIFTVAIKILDSMEKVTDTALLTQPIHVLQGIAKVDDTQIKNQTTALSNQISSLNAILIEKNAALAELQQKLQNARDAQDNLKSKQTAVKDEIARVQADLSKLS